MTKLQLFLSILSLLHFTAEAAHYAVLVAGSNTFANYRHQSDVFHAYQLLISHGIPAENIITLAYDDIASDPDNPFPGQVFNHPSGKDVYAGVQIDYRQEDVTPENFLNVLRGNSTATGGKKVLNSTASDRVFVYFADHGATGLIAFPNGNLWANDFMSALAYMSLNKMYKEMVVYIEACESGSMFEGLLPDNIHIYATSAANSEESSYATYCSPDDVVNGTEIGTCLGDLYSVSFLEDLETANTTLETLLEQYTKVAAETNLSHVEKFGAMKIGGEPIGDFEANEDIKTSSTVESVYRETSTINSRMVKLAYLQRRFERFQSEESRRELIEELESIERFDDIFSTLEEELHLNTYALVKDIDFECLKGRVSLYEAMCGKFSDYGLRYVRYIYYTCSQNISLYDYELVLLQQC